MSKNNYFIRNGANEPYSYSYHGSIMSPYQSRSSTEQSPPSNHSNFYQGPAMEQRYPPPPVKLVEFSTANNKAKKMVTFKPTATVRTYNSSNGSVSEGEKSELYYGRQEIAIFLLEVKAICTLSRELPHERNSNTLLAVAQDSMIQLDDTDGDSPASDTLRGMELLMYPKRQQNKLLVQRSLLKYQSVLDSKPNMNSERKHAALASASAKLNMWSSLVAVETARLDSIRAYEEDYRITVGAPGPLAIIPPFPFYKKRQRRRGSGQARLDVDGASQQSKRRKTELS